ncbi:MAG: hypothetical protein PWR10_1826 [Halanaerobiales bacterium]|nr:hypothetical protein [Halanaerobiales bacterium]
MALFNFHNKPHLNPAEILFLDYLDGCPTDIDCSHLPKYWKYDYNLRNPERVINMLKSDGYLKVSDYKFNMDKCKIDELKNILKKYGLKVSGKKSDLIDRIIQNIPEEDCIKLFNHSYYQHTEKAHSLLSKNNHIIYAHKMRNYLDISIFEADNMKKAMPEASVHDIFLSVLNNRLARYSKNKDWGLYRNTIHAMSLIYHDLSDYNKELQLLSEVCYRDLSGLGNNGTIDELDITALAPGIINSIIKAKSCLSLDDSRFKEFYLSAVSNINLSFHYFTPEQTFDILLAEMYGDEKTIKDIYKKAKKRPKRRWE